ncbi:hypothetical protein RRG08_008424 [Elysia crispata]|uniref:Uncharacterized protein n=1 Tax=Elysia crispata TaxID=231223 RepID=A0AAE1DHA3_9GAST|nr:hypothetical protein RRG08_008424 [Elysia crispata]
MLLYQSSDIQLAGLIFSDPCLTAFSSFRLIVRNNSSLLEERFVTDNRRLTMSQLCIPLKTWRFGSYLVSTFVNCTGWFPHRYAQR